MERVVVHERLLLDQIADHPRLGLPDFPYRGRSSGHHDQENLDSFTHSRTTRRGWSTAVRAPAGCGSRAAWETRAAMATSTSTLTSTRPRSKITALCTSYCRSLGSADDRNSLKSCFSLACESLSMYSMWPD